MARTNALRKRTGKENRREFVYDRDGEMCVYCGEAQRGPTWTDPKPVRLTLDHIVTVSEGGPNYRTNLVTCCDSCNNYRGDMDIVAWLYLLRPHTTLSGARAVRMVIRALRGSNIPGERGPIVERALIHLESVYRDMVPPRSQQVGIRMETVAANLIRNIHKTLDGLEECPGMYGSPEAIEAQYRVLLFVLGAGFAVESSLIRDTLWRVTTSRVGGGPTATLAERCKTEGELIEGLKEMRAEVAKLLQP